MQVAFFCEYGKIPEVGTGHYWRSQVISKELQRRGHETFWVVPQNDPPKADVLVIDHVHSQSDLILRAKELDIKIALIDGTPEDAAQTDASVSAFYNSEAQHKGIEYIAFPKCPSWIRYKPDTKSRTVFIGMGGFDASNFADILLKVLDKMQVNAIVAKSINHPDFTQKYSRVEMFREENYYDAFHECVIGITNGGLTLFQALHYGLPCLALSQYPHQQNNIDKVAACCVPIEPDEGIIELKAKELLEHEGRRRYLSLMGQTKVDGKGVDRICSIIEGLR